MAVIEYDEYKQKLLALEPTLGELEKALGIPKAREELAELQKELAELRDEFNAKKAQWENEKNAIGKVQKLREELEQANADLEKAQREYDLNRAARLASMYKVVLTEASTVEDLNTWLDADLLRRLWPTLWLPPQLRQRWEEAFPELAATRSTAA